MELGLKGCPNVSWKSWVRSSKWEEIVVVGIGGRGKDLKVRKDRACSEETGKVSDWLMHTAVLRTVAFAAETGDKNS